jgi:hypothetical protein
MHVHQGEGIQEEKGQKETLVFGLRDQENAD